MEIEDRIRDTLQKADTTVVIEPRRIVEAGRRRRLKGRVGLATVLVMLLAGTGVGANELINMHSGHATVQPAFAAGSTDTQPTGPELAASYQAGLVEWVNCLARNGVRVTPPTGHPYDNFLAELGTHKGDADYESAAKECSTLLPVITPELEAAWGQK